MTKKHIKGSIMTDKDYILKREERGVWYSYPTGNLYHDVDTVLRRVETDLNNIYGEKQHLKKLFEVADGLIMAYCDDEIRKNWIDFKNGDLDD